MWRPQDLLYLPLLFLLLLTLLPPVHLLHLLFLSSLCFPIRRSELRGGGGRRSESGLSSAIGGCPPTPSLHWRTRKTSHCWTCASSLFPPRSLRRSLSKQCHCRRQMFGFLPAECRVDVYAAQRSVATHSKPSARGGGDLISSLLVVNSLQCGTLAEY